MTSRLKDTSLDYTINLKKEVNTIFDLSYILIDLQAIISGYVYVNELYDMEHVKIHKRDSADYNDGIVDQILKTIDDVVEVKELHKKILEDRIHRIVKIPEKAAKGKDVIRPFPTSSRKFANRYKDYLKVKKFEQGSILLDITSNVIIGLILKFLERLFSDQDKITVSITNNNIIIIKDNNEVKVLKQRDFSEYKLNDNNGNMYSASQYIDSIIDQVDIDKYNIEKSVSNFLDVLSNEKIISKEITYDKRAKKTFINDIERFSGNLFDMKG